MIIEIFIALIIGLIAGTITGLTPGIHMNLVAAFIIAFSAIMINYASPLAITIFIISMSIAHTFLDFLPSVYLGAPDSGTELSILPGHKMLLLGKGHDAVVYTLWGSAIGIIIILLSSLPLIKMAEKIYPVIEFFIPLILIIISLFTIFRENEKIISFIIFLLAGFLGIASMNQNISQPLLPLLTGLFGGSTLLLSISKREKIPRQIITPIKKLKISWKEIKSSSIASFTVSPLFSLLPGISASHVAVIGTSLLKSNEKTKNPEKEFLILLGSINTIMVGLSFITLYILGKTRTGSAVAISSIAENFFPNYIAITLVTILFAGIFSFIVAIQISKFFAKNISRINYRLISTIVLLFVVVIVAIVTSIEGLLIFFTSAFLGIYTISRGLNRTLLMGCLLIPVILFYLF